MSSPDSTFLPDFTPVPLQRRHDGWTPERQRAFIEALADTGSVKHAVQRVGMSPTYVYALRRMPGGESFAAAWDAALELGVRTLVDIAIDRAKHGVPVPVFYKGEQCGERRWYNDRLLMFILAHHMPSKYGADRPRGGRLADPAPVEDDPDGEKARASIEAKVALWRRRLQDQLLQNRARVRRAFYDRYAYDPAKRAAWETLHERSIETLLSDAHDAAEADVRAAGADEAHLLEDWRDAPPEEDEE